MKNILIIGASSGIGRQLSIDYCKLGYNVIAASRNSRKLIDLKKLYPKQVTCMQIDITDTTLVPQILSNIFVKNKQIDIIVITAGVGDINRELLWEIERQTIETNILGTTSALIESYKQLKNQGHGQIVTISSIASTRGSNICPSYAASKAFLNNYIEGLRKKSAKEKSNINFTNIIPGFVNTKMAKGNNLFWVSSVQKASKQIINGISKNRKKVFVTKRWLMIKLIFKIIPDFIYNKL